MEHAAEPNLWARTRSVVAGAALALSFILEPWLWRLRLGVFHGPLVIWVVETVVGVALLIAAMAIRQRNSMAALTTP